jgi:hypothetical protein
LPYRNVSAGRDEDQPHLGLLACCATWDHPAAR